MKRPWSQQLRYSWMYELIEIVFGDTWAWHWYRDQTLPDVYQEQMKDFIGLYCMGGEL